jgi:hypothetical protein
MRGARALITVASTVLAVGTLTALPAAASADPYPWPATNMHPTAITATSFTIAVTPGANDAKYRLWASTDYHDLFTSHMNHDVHTSALKRASSRTRIITLSGLPYSASTWYYRVESINGTRHSYTKETGKLGLRPSTPTGLSVSSTSTGTYLTWIGAQANGYDVDVTDTRTATTTRYHVRTVRSAAQQFTPPDLIYGDTYSFRVRAWNSGTKSVWTLPYSMNGPVASQLQSVRVMTYNLLTAQYDGDPATSGAIISPWAQRAQKAAELLMQQHPDVLGVQEGWQQDVEGFPSDFHQVDGLVADANANGGDYEVADTSTPYTPSSTGLANHQTGNFIVYDASQYEPATIDGYSGGYWTLDNGPPSHNAVFQVLRPVDGSNPGFLFVTTHLPVQNGAAADQQREAETTAMIGYASALGQLLGIPVIYSGDYNSHPLFDAHPLDGPQVAMSKAGVVDDAAVALTKENPSYASVNEYFRTPPQNGMDLDYVWLPPGVAGTDWGVVLPQLSSTGQFVGAIPSDHNPVAATVEYPY